MADIALEKFSRGMKVFYEQAFNSLVGGKRGIDEILFPLVDSDLSSNFAYDDLIFTPHAIAFRKPDGQSQVIPYTPGVGRVYEIPIASAKTPVDERLRNAVVAGGEAIEAFASANGRLMTQILRQHACSWNVTKWKLALDQLKTGIYSPLGLGGHSIGLEVDQSRDASLSVSYNFTNSGATMDIALREMWVAGRAKNLPASNIVCLMGRKWLNEFETDTTVQGKREANVANETLQQSMTPAELNNTFGLYRVGMYRPAGVTVPFQICTFEVDKSFYQYEGATAEDFLDENTCILFSLDSSRWTVNRGLDIKNDSGAIVRVVGDVVYDDFTENDPCQYNVRSQIRKAFFQADPNTVVVSRGTFGTDS